MTVLLEKAITRIYALPSNKQDAIASVILEELDDDLRWDAAFASSQDKLTTIAQKVRSDIRAGRVQELGIDEL